MPTFTPNKAYDVPVVGSDTNNWGTLLNTSLGIIDRNLGGELVKAVGGNTDVTLNSTEAQNLVYALTGILTGNVNVLWPATIGLYLVSNQTTGSFALTLKSTVPGGTVTIPRGGFAIIYSDGTNFFNLPNAADLNLHNLNVAVSAIIQGQLTAAVLFSTGNTTVDGALFVGGAALVTGQTTLSGSLILGDAEIAAAGTDQGSAAQIVSTAAFISGGSGGVKLPAAAAGRTIIVGNPQGANYPLYPGSGAIMIGKGAQGGVNAPITLAGQTLVSCYARNSTTWMYN